MKIVDQEREVNTDITFRVWRKFATHRHIPYESWEEGKVVLLNKLDRKLLTDFR